MEVGRVRPPPIFKGRCLRKMSAGNKHGGGLLKGSEAGTRVVKGMGPQRKGTPGGGRSSESIRR